MAKAHKIFLEIMGTENACLPSIESGQAFNLKIIEGTLYGLYVTLHSQDCDAIWYEESEAALGLHTFLIRAYGDLLKEIHHIDPVAV